MCVWGGEGASQGSWDEHVLARTAQRDEQQERASHCMARPICGVHSTDNKLHMGRAAGRAGMMEDDEQPEMGSGRSQNCRLMQHSEGRSSCAAATAPARNPLR